jgi:hypothetical protein
MSDMHDAGVASDVARGQIMALKVGDKVKFKDQNGRWVKGTVKGFTGAAPYRSVTIDTEDGSTMVRPEGDVEADG